MWRLIETDAPAGSVIEHQGAEWWIHGASDWPGEAECERVEKPDPDAPVDEEAIVEAMADLELLGLWETDALTDIDRLRARARAANEELLELASRG